jgi:hypothetical protein
MNNTLKNVLLALRVIFFLALTIYGYISKNTLMAMIGGILLGLTVGSNTSAFSLRQRIRYGNYKIR